MSKKQSNSRYPIPVPYKDPVWDPKGLPEGSYKRTISGFESVHHLNDYWDSISGQKKYQKTVVDAINKDRFKI